jgi:hypothetical protein
MVFSFFKFFILRLMLIRLQRVGALAFVKAGLDSQPRLLLWL